MSRRVGASTLSCRDFEALLSERVEATLDPAAARGASAHLRRCPSCRRLERELRGIVEDLPLLAEAVPGRLAARLAREVSLPAARPWLPAAAAGAGPSWRRETSWITWKRAAAWAVVFLGAWWQVFGGAVSSFAADEVAPAAQSVLVEVSQAARRDAARRRGVLGRLGRVNDDLSQLGEGLHEALFGPEAGGGERADDEQGTAPRTTPTAPDGPSPPASDETRDNPGAPTP